MSNSNEVTECPSCMSAGSCPVRYLFFHSLEITLYIKTMKHNLKICLRTYNEQLHLINLVCMLYLGGLIIDICFTIQLTIQCSHTGTPVSDRTVIYHSCSCIYPTETLSWKGLSKQFCAHTEGFWIWPFVKAVSHITFGIMAKLPVKKHFLIWW